jgi:hypothetical protein
VAILAGGTAPFPGRNNHLTGLNAQDIIFGDPFTTGAADEFPRVPALGVLAAGRGGMDVLFGDA